MYKLYSKTFLALLFVVTALLYQPTFAADNYKVGDKLYVAPTAGINIRSRPSLQAPILAKLNYNTAVTVAADSLPAEPLQVRVKDFNEGFMTLQGHWVKVKSGRITGYVFDGMLSSVKGLELNNYQEEAYFADTFGKPRKETIQKSKVVEGHKADSETVITTHPKGIVVEYTFFDGCHDLTYTFDIPFNDVYWLINRMMVGADAVQDVKIRKEGKRTVLTYYSCT
ncbi:SH3 domain-containing protein [Pontibacter kalidii]|uniref:SH3 domain-containing protein n=1 Tax=Pontibacter kalidii TaxID=2592049 RepID=UPI002258B906|nr:SH3 domain-containing protein [Pontibacter kalidii]